MCVFACVSVNVNLSVSVNESVNVRAKRQVSSWNAWTDISPPQLLDLLSLSLTLSVHTTPLVPLPPGAVARVAQYVSLGLYHSPCSTDVRARACFAVAHVHAGRRHARATTHT